MNTEKVTARRLTAGEVSELGLQDDIFVSAEMDGLPLDCYAPAFLTKPGKNFEGGSFIARTIFGEEMHVLPDNVEECGIWIADKAGEEIEVLQSAGVLLNLALFVPDGNKESLDSLYSAARDAFGAGIVQRWSEESVAVPDVKVDLYEEPPGGGRTRTAKTATAVPWTSTRPECGSWSPAMAGGSLSNRTRRSSMTHRRSDLMAG